MKIHITNLRAYQLNYHNKLIKEISFFHGLIFKRSERTVSYNLMT